MKIVIEVVEPHCDWRCEAGFLPIYFRKTEEGGKLQRIDQENKKRISLGFTIGFCVLEKERWIFILLACYEELNVLTLPA